MQPTPFKLKSRRPTHPELVDYTQPSTNQVFLVFAQVSKSFPTPKVKVYSP